MKILIGADLVPTASNEALFAAAEVCCICKEDAGTVFTCYACG